MEPDIEVKRLENYLRVPVTEPVRPSAEDVKPTVPVVSELDCPEFWLLAIGILGEAVLEDIGVG